jgi:transposase-like protein
MLTMVHALFFSFESYRKGIARSALPYRRAPPSWCKTTPEEVTEQIAKLAKKGLTPSQIGVILRDSHGIAQVSSITGSKILRILKGNGTCLRMRLEIGASQQIDGAHLLTLLGMLFSRHLEQVSPPRSPRTCTT